MRRALLTLIVLAPSRGSADAPKDLPAHVAPLFDKGRSWIYDTARTTWDLEAEERTHKRTKKTERVAVTCKVDDVAMRNGVAVSHVACDKDFGRKFRVAGYYAGSKDGLWRLGLDAPNDRDLASAVASPVTIAAKPRAVRNVRKMGGPDPKHDDIVEGIRAIAGGWCVFTDTSNADVDGGTESICYANGVGIASGLDDVGGELNRFEFTARKR